MFEKGTAKSRAAVVKVISGLVSSTTSKGFTVTGYTLEYLTSVAVKISDALSDINDGLQQSIYAADMLISTVNGTYQYQKSDNGNRNNFIF